MKSKEIEKLRANAKIIVEQSTSLVVFNFKEGEVVLSGTNFNLEQARKVFSHLLDEFGGELLEDEFEAALHSEGLSKCDCPRCRQELLGKTWVIGDEEFKA